MVLFLQKIQVHCHISQSEVFLRQFTVGFEPLTMNIKIISAIYISTDLVTPVFQLKILFVFQIVCLTTSECHIMSPEVLLHTCTYLGMIPSADPWNMYTAPWPKLS